MKSSLRFTTIDVSALAPPEPMTVILTHLAKLTQFECLLVKHRRQPFPLYEKLIEAGFSYHCIEHAHDNISLYIFRQNVQALFDQTVANTALSKGNDK